MPQIVLLCLCVASCFFAEILRRVVHPLPQQFEVIRQRRDVSSNQGLLDALMEATANGREGLIVKNENSPYRLADRSDFVRPTQAEHKRAISVAY